MPLLDCVWKLVQQGRLEAKIGCVRLGLESNGENNTISRLSTKEN